MAGHSARRDGSGGLLIRYARRAERWRSVRLGIATTLDFVVGYDAADCKGVEAMSSLVKGVIRNGRVEVAEPIDLPDGTEVVVTSEPTWPDDSPPPPAEIARVLAAMNRLQPLEIPDEVAADLEAWDDKFNNYGIGHPHTSFLEFNTQSP